MEPNPIQWDSISTYEEPTKEKEVGQNGYHNCVAQHDMGHNARKECDERTPGPKRSANSEEEEEEAMNTAR